MRILVLGGTRFVSKATAAEAVERGHEVVCACRGTSGPLPDGVRHVVTDRAAGLPDELVDDFDAVVDVGRTPSWVREAVARFPSAHWVFVSTVNVYADDATPGGRPGVTPLVEPIHDDVDLAVDMEAYGPMKVSCEQAVTAGAASATIIRPGLIVGPEDPSGRFTYWPARLGSVRDGEQVLAPGQPHDTMQVIDARDLAAWIVTAAEARTAGEYDGVGSVMPISQMLEEIAEGVGVAPSWTWVPSADLERLEVQPWAGPRSVPLWLPRPDYDGLPAHDPQPSYDAGLVTRPVAETAHDTLAWLLDEPDAVVTGLTRDEELAVLAEVTLDPR